MGFFFGLKGSNRRAEGRSCLFGTITIFPESVLRNSNSSWRLSLSHKDQVLCTNVERTLVCLRDGDVIQGLGSGLCGSVFGGPYGPRAIRSLVYVDVEKGKLAFSLHLHGELYSLQAAFPASQYRSV